jgi:plastocyanin
LWLVGAVLAVEAAAPSKTPTAVTHTIVMENVQFNPQTLIVRRGDRVVWVNKDFFPHTATGKAKEFNSGSIAPKASWTYVVKTAKGEHTYACDFHPTMLGKLIVQ